MHSYLRSIGLKNVKTRKQEKDLINSIIKTPDTSRIIKTKDNGNIAALSRDFSNGTGIIVCGEYVDDEFLAQFYYPYANAVEISTTETCYFNKHVENDSLSGLCEDARIGVSLIFYLTNMFDIKEYNASFGYEPDISYVRLAALCSEGKVLLPLEKSSYDIEKAKVVAQNKHNMIKSAREGDDEALENLSIHEMNICQVLNERIRNEDVYSLVDSCFMPSGIECEQYSVIGEILSVDSFINPITGETIFDMLIEANEMKFRTLINKEDLLGEPLTGRRIKCSIWMQGEAIIKKEQS